MLRLQHRVIPEHRNLDGHSGTPEFRGRPVIRLAFCRRTVEHGVRLGVGRYTVPIYTNAQLARLESLGAVARSGRRPLLTAARAWRSLARTMSCHGRPSSSMGGAIHHVAIRFTQSSRYSRLALGQNARGGGDVYGLGERAVVGTDSTEGRLHRLLEGDAHAPAGGCWRVVSVGIPRDRA